MTIPLCGKTLTKCGKIWLLCKNVSLILDVRKDDNDNVEITLGNELLNSKPIRMK